MTEPSVFQQVVAVANGILSILACLLLIGAAVGAVLAWRAVARARGPMAVLQRDLGPLVATLGKVARNLEGATATIHSDVQAIHETVGDANERARAAIQGAGDRLRRLDTAVGAAQTEVEEALVDIVATARGLRAGAAVLRGILGLADRTGAPAPTGSGSLSEGAAESDLSQLDELEESHETEDLGHAREMERPATDERPGPRTRSRRSRL
jgi:hypothetical protein